MKTMTMGEWVAYAETYTYSQDYYNITKEACAVTLMAEYVDSLDFYTQNPDLITESTIYAEAGERDNVIKRIKSSLTKLLNHAAGMLSRAWKALGVMRKSIVEFISASKKTRSDRNRKDQEIISQINDSVGKESLKDMPAELSNLLKSFVEKYETGNAFGPGGVGITINVNKSTSGDNSQFSQLLKIIIDTYQIDDTETKALRLVEAIESDNCHIDAAPLIKGISTIDEPVFNRLTEVIDVLRRDPSDNDSLEKSCKALNGALIYASTQLDGAITRIGYVHSTMPLSDLINAVSETKKGPRGSSEIDDIKCVLDMPETFNRTALAAIVKNIDIFAIRYSQATAKLASMLNWYKRIAKEASSIHAQLQSLISVE